MEGKYIFLKNSYEIYIIIYEVSVNLNYSEILFMLIGINMIKV